MKIYEIVDASSDEQYFTIGLFLTLEDAVSQVEFEGVSIISELDGDDHTVEIREREVGKLEWSGTGKKVWRRMWERDWSKEDDEWHVISEEPTIPMRNNHG